MTKLDEGFGLDDHVWTVIVESGFAQPAQAWSSDFC